MSQMPVLFAGHGNPMNALNKNAFTESLNLLGKKIPKPQAILCVSAHWETPGIKIAANSMPPTIHDFYGFPQSLFDVNYPAPGSPSWAEEAKKLLPDSELTSQWGLDHGAWTVLLHLYPKADIPVFQLSLNTQFTTEQHFQAGRQLRALREKEILILGSGNIVHNLGSLLWQQPHAGLPWAQSFDQGIKDALDNRDFSSIINYKNKFTNDALKAVPTEEHFLPLLYCLGAALDSDHISYPYEGYEYGSLSMRSVLFST